MRRLIDQLMLLAQVDADRAAHVPPARLDLGDIAAEVIAQLAPIALDQERRLALEGDVAALGLEEAAQHEAVRLGIVGHAAAAEAQQRLGQLAGEALVLDMLCLKPFQRIAAAPLLGENAAVGRKQRLLLQPVDAAHQRLQLAGDPQAFGAVDASGQRIGHLLQQAAEPQHLGVRRLDHRRHAVAAAMPRRAAVPRGRAGDRVHAPPSLGVRPDAAPTGSAQWPRRRHAALTWINAARAQTPDEQQAGGLSLPCRASIGDPG